MAVKPTTDLSLRRKEVVFVEGYMIEVAKELAPSLNTTDLVDDVYGSDNPLTQTIVDNASLSVTVLERKDNNKILDVLTGQDPDATGVKEYFCDDARAVAVWVNKKNSANTAYERSFFYNNWTPAIPLSAGGPKERGTRVLNGLCDKPLEFENAGILSEKVILSGTWAGGIFSGTIGNTPVAVPKTGFNAIRVLACSGTGSSMVFEEVTVTAAMVNSAKWITIPNSATTTVKGPTSAFINYLTTSTGIYPSTTTIYEEGLYIAAT